MALAWLRPLGPASVTGGSVALLLAVGTFLAAVAIAGARSIGTRRLIHLGLLGAVAFGLLAQGYNAVANVAMGQVPRFPSPGLWLVLLGAHPSLMLGYAAAIGRRRRAVRFETLVDTLLLTVAAALLGILLSYLSNWPAGSAIPRGAQPFVILWQCLPAAELILLALLLASRGEALGIRTSAALTLGTLSLAMATISHVRLETIDSAAAVTGSDPLWALALFCFSIGITAPSDREDQSGTFPAFRIGTMRGRFVVVAILISAGSALVLGFRHAPSPELAVAAAVFGLLLAARAAQAIAAQERETRQLSSSVTAERELSALLEHRVGERTAQLADAQRVLQRMLALGQQITTELQPERVLQRFVEAVVDVARADGGALGILHGDAIRITAATGTGANLAGEVIPIAGSAMGRVARSGRAWANDDLLTAHAGAVWEPTNERAEGGPARGIAVVPITRRGERIGAVSVVSVAPRHFSPKEIARIEAMADMLSVALANAELVETLRQAEWRFRTLFRAAPDAVLTVLQSGRVREANDAVRDIAGIDPLQMPGRLLADLVAPEDRARLEEAVAAAFAGNATRLEVRFARAEGPPRLVALAASRVPEADPPTVLLIGRDTTAEREMRARLMETERLAAVGELVAGVAHEVNNPLSSISAFAQLLLRERSLRADQRESVEVIRSEAVRAAQVVKDLLAFARRSDPQREPVDLNVVVERSLRLRGYQLQASSVRLEQTLAPRLPAVVGDARQLQQVIINLVTNAVQAMSQIGGGVLRLATRQENGRVLLEVADTGPGIDPRVRARIFEPFVTTKQEGEGTGLGLSVTYGIVAAHGGTINVKETTSDGTTFVVSLPAADAAVAAVAPEAPQPSARSGLAGISLLFVDDEPALRGSMEAFGRLRGFAVVTAAEGRTALEAVEATSFDAVVCDLRMPGMDGFAFHEVLRRQRPGLAKRTIFITGDVVTAGNRAVPASRQPMLTKPFAFERLEEVLVAVMRGEPIPPSAAGAIAG